MWYSCKLQDTSFWAHFHKPVVSDLLANTNHLGKMCIHQMVARDCLQLQGEIYHKLLYSHTQNTSLQLLWSLTECQCCLQFA